MTALYQFKNCKDCDEPLYWDNNIRSQKTGGKIPLNSDGTKHFTTCEAREDLSPQQPQQNGEVVKGPIPIDGPRDWEEKLGLLNGQIFARLDRIDKSVMEITKSLAVFAKYLESNQRMADSEAAYDRDREEGGLV